MKPVRLEIITQRIVVRPLRIVSDHEPIVQLEILKSLDYVTPVLRIIPMPNTNNEASLCRPYIEVSAFTNKQRRNTHIPPHEDTRARDRHCGSNKSEPDATSQAERMRRLEQRGLESRL